jgi:hypothetical protein
MRLPFDRFLNLVYYFLTENADEQERDKFDIRLNTPPPEERSAVPASSPWSPQNETAALGSLSAALGMRSV